MSGIFIDDSGFYENTGKICKRCESPVWQSGVPEYSFQCLRCDEDLYKFEVEEQDPRYMPRVIIGRHAHGITLNNQLEFIMDDEGNKRIFDNQPDAEAFLLSSGFDDEDLEFMYFVEIDHKEAENEIKTSYIV